MNREELEARFLEILASGGEPMDRPEIREAVAGDPELAAELEELRRFTAGFDDMRWPELDERQNVDYMARAFEEGFRQGRGFALHQTEARHGARQLWHSLALVAAVFVGIVAGAQLWPRIRGDELNQLRADVQGLQEMVAVSLLENTSAAQRLRGLQWSAQVAHPGEKLINELSETLRQDESVNVRLAAADVLSNFAGRPEIRSALHETVLSEAHPLVQVQLIDVLVVVDDPDARNVLHQLLQTPGLDDVVRAKAKEALEEIGEL